MRKTRMWLMSLPLLALCSPLNALAEEAKPVSATIEAGGAGIAISDDIKRVNEYTAIKKKPGVNPYGKADVNIDAGFLSLDADARYVNSYDQTYGARLDVNRALKSDFAYDAFHHWLDHDKIDYLDAGVRNALLYNPALPLSPDNIPAGFTAYNPATGQVTAAAPGAGVQQFGRATVYGEDFVPNQDFSIVRREWKNKTDLTIPQLPNVTFHIGYRQEERKGYEQSIGMSKCTACHITGESREVNEVTKDLTAGATGKFGLLTVNYSYLNRDFREKAAAPTRVWDPQLNPGANLAFDGSGNIVNPNFDNRLLYAYSDGRLPYDVTPDSDKDSHVVKAKVDLPNNTAVVGTYVKSSVESNKFDEPGIFLLDKKKLETTYDAYGVRASTKLTKNLTLAARARFEKLENDDPTITFSLLNNTASTAGITPDPSSLVRTRESVMDRDVATFGLDATYRLARFTTLNLGYEYKEVDREDHHFGKTETHTAKAAFKTRPAKNVNTRISYKYQSIDNPFTNPDAALYQNPVTGLNYFDKDGNVATTFGDSTTWAPGYILGTGPTYGVEFYDRRVADMSNQPEDVHEAQFSTTWAPAANFAGTIAYRGKFEKNELDHSKWKQDTHSPTATLWYAPAEKLSLTLSYNYFMQRNQADFCQGWYDG